MSKDFYQSYEYWFENQEQLSEVSNYDENYYVYKIYKDLVPSLNIPSDGYIVVLGTHKCISFDLLCKIYGEDRCVGYDLFNPSNHSRVIIKDCMSLSDLDNIPIAFCHNDLGNFPKTPGLKLHAQEWAAKNVVDGGVFLSRNNNNSKKIDLEGLMEGFGFENLQFKNLDVSKFKLGALTKDEVDTHMFSIRRKIVI